jgi:hypothetical protein
VRWRLWATAAVALCLLVVVGAAAAGQTWTPKQMGAALKNPQVKLVGVFTSGDWFKEVMGNRPNGNVTRAACQGLDPRARMRGTRPRGYALFHCQITYNPSNLGGGPFTGSYWTRPWSKSLVCVTNVSQGTCPPPLPARPLPGDPRNCSVTKTDPLNGPLLCPRQIAEKAAAEEKTYYAHIACVPSSRWTVYRCTRPGRASVTVTFRQGKTRWTTVVHELF